MDGVRFIFNVKSEPDPRSLKAIDYEPHDWFLLREEDVLLLDVACSPRGLRLCVRK
jgi:hypothetical protein